MCKIVLLLSGGWICPAGGAALLHPVWLCVQQRQRPEGGRGVHRHAAHREQIHDQVDPTHQRSTLRGIMHAVKQGSYCRPIGEQGFALI